MLVPVSRMKKSEIVWLANHYCQHKHTYLDHYNCYLKENPCKERIGFFDTENSSLNAEFGIMLCYCIKDGKTNKIHERSITKAELVKCLDKEVVASCVADLKKFDRIVTYFGKYYDFPFVRTRAVVHDIPFMNYGELIHDDIYFIIKNKFKMTRNRLENTCRLLVGSTEKTHIDPTRWIKAMQGDSKAIAWILDHCRRDVRDLQRLYDKVITFQRKTDTSI